mgnify:CR=1 FL=1
MATFQAEAEHAPVVAAMLFEFNSEFDSPVPSITDLTRRFTALLARDDVLVLVTGEPDQPTGFAYVTLRPTPYFDGPLAQLEELYVRPELRGQGIGGELMASLLQQLSELGCGEIDINVDEVDTDARRFYETHGFTNTEPGTDDRMLCYVRELDSSPGEVGVILVDTDLTREAEQAPELDERVTPRRGVRDDITSGMAGREPDYLMRDPENAQRPPASIEALEPRDLPE